MIPLINMGLSFSFYIYIRAKEPRVNMYERKKKKGGGTGLVRGGFGGGVGDHVCDHETDRSFKPRRREFKQARRKARQSEGGKVWEKYEMKLEKQPFSILFFFFFLLFFLFSSCTH